MGRTTNEKNGDGSVFDCAHSELRVFTNEMIEGKRPEELIHEAEEGGENTWLERIEFGIHVQNEATRQTVLDDLVPRIRAYQKNRRSCKIKQPFLQWSVKAKHDTSCMGSPQCDCSWLKKPCEDGFEGDGTSCRKHCCCQRAMESEVMNR